MYIYAQIKRQMSDQEAGAGSPDSVRTLFYEDGESDGNLTPLYYPNDHNYGNVDRPWMLTREDKVKFQEIRQMFARVSGPRAFWKGWDRIRTHPVPVQKCKCCGQKIRKRSTAETSYVLTEREYRRFDEIFHQATAELNMATGNVIERHLGNVYRILTGNEAFLERGSRIVLFARIQNIIAAINNLFRQSVPDSDVQTR